MIAAMIETFDDKRLVWYAAYGSNLSESRFLCYIRGGTPAGTSKEYPGCRDQSMPLKSANIQIDRALYFAKRSGTWGDGGVAFLSTVNSRYQTSLGRMYLITAFQYADIIKQEIDDTTSLAVNFAAALDKGAHIFMPGSWYGNLLCLGTAEGSPIFTFTHETDIRPFNKPSAAYLKYIMLGIREAYPNISMEQAAAYLLPKPGVAGNYTLEQLLGIFIDGPR